MRATSPLPQRPAALRRVAHAVVQAGDDMTTLGERLADGEWEMVELDVMAHDGALLVAHDAADLARCKPVAFEHALETLRDLLAPGVTIDVDLKATGYEHAVLDALARTGTTERALISSMHPSSLRALRAADPSLRLGLSVPRSRRDYLAHPFARPFALVALAALRRAVPRRAAAAVTTGLADAIMAHWLLVTPALVRSVAEAGGELFAWTVDDPERVRALDALGITGVIANDPTVFSRAGVPA